MDTIVVTDWEKVDKGDFYLSKDWLRNTSKETMREAKKLQREGHLYEAYEVSALSYALYTQMGAHKIFINHDGDHVMSCESAIIGNNHEERWQGDSY